MMFKNLKKILLLILISIFLVVFNVVIKNNIILYAESIMAAFMLIILFLSLLFWGYQKDKKYQLKSNLFIKVGQVLTLYFIIIYLMGLYFGFSKIVFSLKPVSILNNTLSPIIIFICLEIFRYIITRNNIDDKRYLIIFNIFIGLLELSVSVRHLSFNDFEGVFLSFADYIVPITLKQVMLAYLCYYGGLKGNILYRIIDVLYMYIIPIHPSFSDTMNCMANILLPLALLINISNVVEEDKKEKNILVKGNKLQYVIFLILFGLVGLLVSGYLPISLIAIASNSMSPTFEKGAVVVALKVDGKAINKGDIVSFIKDNKKIIHRVDSIIDDGEVVRYYTKGDANKSVDKDYIVYNDIEDKIIFSIPLIGYPSILINEVFK